MYEKEGFPCLEDPTRAIVAMSALMFFGEKFNEKHKKYKINLDNYKVEIPNKNLNEIDCSEVLLSAGLPILKPILIKDIEDQKIYLEKIKEDNANKNQ